MYLSEPIPTKHFTKNGYLFFDSQKHCRGAYERLNNRKLNWITLRLKPNKQQLSKSVHTSYFEEFDRVSKDLEQAIKVCKALDAEQEFENTQLYQDRDDQSSV